MKRLLSVLLVFSLLTGGFSLCALALDAEDITEYPVIIVPGYAASQLYYTAEDGSTEQVWGLSSDDILTYLLKNIADVGVGLGELTVGDASKISETVGKGAQEVFAKLVCNDDGTSKYDIKPYNTTAEESCSANLIAKYPDGQFRHEQEIMDEVASYVGYENIFNFSCDFRMSVTSVAADLDRYIEDVLAYTGSSKVNIIAISHGGQVSATYLTLYGHKEQVDNAMLAVPAIGGAALAYDLMRGDSDFDEDTLLKFIEYGFQNETDYDWLVKAEQLGILDDIIDGLHPYLIDLFVNWQSVWDFIPAEYYDEMKALNLDPVDNAAIIASSDYTHYTLMPAFWESLQKCRDDYGINVTIIAGTDLPIVSGLDVNSDGIITTASSTGAAVAPLGQRFSDGYTPENGDSTYVSPSMTVDASKGYLPDNTWYIEGMFHGMEYKDPYVARLMMKTLLTDELSNTSSDPAFPRFHATTNPANAVFAAFDKSVEGIVSSADTALNVTNLSKQYQMKILSVVSDGMDLTFSIGDNNMLEPGQSVAIPFAGEIPAVSKTAVGVTVTYALADSPTPVNERTLHFTVMNGEALVYDAVNPYMVLDEGLGGVLGNDAAAAVADVGLAQSLLILIHLLEYLLQGIGL